jgi:hypothetical protein
VKRAAKYMHVHEFQKVILQLKFRELPSIMSLMTQNGRVRTTRCLMCYRYTSHMTQQMSVLGPDLLTAQHT